MDNKITFTLTGFPLAWPSVTKHPNPDDSSHTQGQWIEPVRKTTIDTKTGEQTIEVEISLSDAGLYLVKGAGRREWWSISDKSAVQIEEAQAMRLLDYPPAREVVKSVHPDLLVGDL